MGWQDEAKANMYVDAALRSNNDREFEHNMQLADGAADMLDGLVRGVGKALSEPSPPPKPASSGGGALGLLAVGAAVAGGAFLLSKIFGGSDDKSASNTTSSSSKSAEDYLDSGNNYYNRRQYALAIQEYDKALQINPNHDDARRNRDDAYAELAKLGIHTSNA